MAAGKKLKILRGRPGHYEMHERERVAPHQDKKARESIQPHIVLQRYPAFAIAREKLAAGYDFDIDPEDYLIKVFLKAPITEEDHRKMIVEGKLAVGDKQGAAREQAKIRAPIANRALNVVSRTTKMGCYSFNLPAGPPSSGGTCPAAGLGFMFMNSAELKKQQRALREPRQISVPDFICNGCYALKNSYGNPSQVMFQAVRYMLTLQWLEQGTFVPRMVDAINAARSVSVRSLRGLPKHLHWTVPHPNFFRIHDSGDFVTPEYTRAWFEICQRLPDVHFWSPTRMWATSKGSSTVFEKGVPKNLALRPSAMHFAEPAPIPPKSLLKKVSAGSGSGKVTPPGAWRCPAYEHVSTGGGLGPKLTGAGEEKKFPALRWSAVSAQGKKKSGSATTEEEVRAIMQKRGLTLVSVTAHPLAGQVSEAEGTCGRAHGPNSPFRGGSDLRDTPDQGYGCRACWLSRDTPIFYQEH